MTKKIGITLGCPAGIGPEVLVKGLSFLSKNCPKILSHICIIGDEWVISKTCKLLDTPLPESVEVISISNLEVSPGKPTVESDKAMASYIKKAIELAKEQKIHAIVTCPVSKEGLERAGIHYKGHTHWLAQEFKTKEYVMCFYGENLIVGLVTTHIPLKEVPSKVTPEKLMSSVKVCWNFLKKLKREDPVIAVCGLNPHAGEGGLLGTEEKDTIIPAIKEIRKLGIKVEGPLPADTVFFWALKGRYSLIVALYHDQGLAPFKLIHFEDGVNITLGLPIVRTSPCHGTAYDIAGKGIASEKSFVNSVLLAAKVLGLTS